MMYTKAQRSGLDAWGVPGWSSNELLPYLKKLETYHGVDKNGSYGHEGPIQISTSTFTSSRFQGQFISAIEKVGWRASDDLQDLDSSNGIATQGALRYISPDGARQDTATRYLHPRLRSGTYPNLHVVLKSSVIRVLFDENKRATSVEFTRNPLYQDSSSPYPSPIHTIKARKSIVLSSGALGTPPILERSGLGDPGILSKAGGPVVHPLPGVGSSYEDHQLCLYAYHAALLPSETADSLALSRVDPVSLIQRNDPILGWNAMDVTCKLRPLTQKDIVALGPAFEEAWKRDFEGVPDKPLAMMAPVGCFPHNPSIVAQDGADKQYFAVSCFTVHPYSRGHIHITGPELTTPLDFKTRFLGNEDGVDVKMHVGLYKTERDVVRGMGVYRGEVAACHPPFSKDSKVRAVELNRELDDTRDVEDIEYSAEDDEVIKQLVRENVGTT